jgi:hypothetical protein
VAGLTTHGRVYIVVISNKGTFGIGVIGGHMSKSNLRYGLADWITMRFVVEPASVFRKLVGTTKIT